MHCQTNIKFTEHDCFLPYSLQSASQSLARIVLIYSTYSVHFSNSHSDA